MKVCYEENNIHCHYKFKSPVIVVKDGKIGFLTFIKKYHLNSMHLPLSVPGTLCLNVSDAVHHGKLKVPATRCFDIGIYLMERDSALSLYNMPDWS
ncbi:hypothetical protein XELAEV_18015245mg [Xenopus laevis]|uniref:Uncharacterized protein n=1 Tax=Xenopus laevis TaxID=8355 RepID=A0A974DHM1_XENLA|nr:hypothetical protein XELAEV_18015245mg [Xenopus laevis]